MHMGKEADLGKEEDEFSSGQAAESKVPKGLPGADAGR